MRLSRGYEQLGKGEMSPDGRSLSVTIRIAWWRVLLIRLFGRWGV